MCIYIYIYKALLLLLLLFFVPVRACNNKFSMHLMSSKQSVHPSSPLPLCPPIPCETLEVQLEYLLGCTVRNTRTHTRTHTETLHNFCIVLDALQHITHTHSRLTSASGRRGNATATATGFLCNFLKIFLSICTALSLSLSLNSTCLSLAPVFGGRPKICCSCIFLKFCANI